MPVASIDWAKANMDLNPVKESDSREQISSPFIHK